MSEETYCYEANLYILDVKICRVHNRGRGGADDFDFEEPTLLGRGFLTWKYVQELDDWCKRNLNKWYFEYKKEYVSKSLEVWLSEQVTEYVTWKEFRIHILCMPKTFPRRRMINGNAKAAQRNIVQ